MFLQHQRASIWNKTAKGEKTELNIIIESNVLQSVSGLSGGKNKPPNAPNLQEKQLAAKSIKNTAFNAKVIEKILD
jgi:hypothetical protein